MHPNDVVAALQWAVKQAENNSGDPLASLNLAVLRELLANAITESRK